MPPDSMTESEAINWLERHDWWDGRAGDRLRLFADMVIAENDRQNLIARSTISSLWARHIVDSAQLVVLALARGGVPSSWLDIGTGAGFPGFVVACLCDFPITLVEPRPLRTAFLSNAAQALSLRHVSIVTGKVERQAGKPYAVISARAYAPLGTILATARHLADADTLWLLPKGQLAEKELVMAQREWQGVFHVEQSVTDASGRIILGQDVGPRNGQPGRGGGNEKRGKRPGR